MVTLLHTGDWHLGRILHGLHLTEAQASLLDQLAAIVAERRPDALLVAGDVYDRAVPPPEAVALLDRFLVRVVRDLGVPVVMIAGNHDGAERLAFGARLLAPEGLHVRGTLDLDADPVVIEDEHGPVEIWPLPYVDPVQVRAAFEALDRAAATDDDATDADATDGDGGDGAEDEEDGDRAPLQGHDAATRAVLDHIRERGRFAERDGVRRVLVAHAFVAGGEVGDSERPLSVGGAGTVGAGAFAGFHYVALGHLHRPQRLDGAPIHYAGSLFKYSFSEVGQTKSVNLVHLDAEGAATVERLPLEPSRDLRRVEGTLAEILASADGRREDYLCAVLRDEGPVFDAMGKLREVFPNVLHIERPALLAPAPAGGGASWDRRERSDEDLFATFFADMTGEPLSDEQREALREVLREVAAADREATA